MKETLSMEACIDYSVFESVDIRLGTVVKACFFEKARNPALQVWVDFGPEVGILQTSSQITVNYQPEALIGKRVMGCINLGEKKVAGFRSQFLLLGFADVTGAILLATAEGEPPNGARLY